MHRGIIFTGCLLCLFMGCLAEYQCPPPSDIQPCTCNPSTMLRTVSCKKMTNTEELYAVFDRSGDFPFRTFELLNSTLMYLPVTSVKKKNIKALRISKCTMTSIFENKPDPSNSLEWLWVKDSRFQRGIEWTFFSSFNKLHTLFLDSVEVRKIGKLFKDNVNNALEAVRISNGKTAVMEDDVFASLPKITEIQVTKGLIKTLKRSMFPAENVLFYLNFKENSIKSLPEDIFSNMPYLTQVDLGNNKLTTIPENIYINVYRRLRSYILLDGNPLNCDCSILWLYPKRTLSFLRGTCAEPPSKKGNKIELMSRWNFPHC